MRRLKSLVKSFYYALCGIGYCIRHERNFRIHIAAALTVTIFSILYGLERQYVPALAITITVMMSFEAFNTAIEKTIDHCAPEFSQKAKIAKDVSAGAVMLAAVCAVVLAVFTFCDPDKLLRVARIFAAPLPLAGLLLYAAICVLFIHGRR